MKNIVSKHLTATFGKQATIPGDRRRFEEFIQMLSNHEFQLVNAIEGEAERFYEEMDAQPLFLFLFEAFRCTDPECECFVYETTAILPYTEKDQDISVWSMYLQRFINKCKASGYKNEVPSLEAGKSLPAQLVHGAWLVTAHPDRPMDLSTHILVPDSISLEFGRDMIYDAVDSEFSPF